MHTTEMVADACPDSVGIARRNRSSAGAELSRRCYLVVAVVAPVSTTVHGMTAAQRAVEPCGIDGPRHQARPGLTHRQTVLGALEDRRVVCCRSRRPAVIPHRFPAQVLAVADVGG